MKRQADDALTVVGAYLRMLREYQRRSRVEVAAAVGTNESQLLKIEAGTIDTRGSLLLRLVWVLHGSSEEVMTLLTDPTATTDQAQEMAVAWLEMTGHARAPFRHGYLWAESMARVERERAGNAYRSLTFPLPAELYEPLLRMAELQGRTLHGLLMRIVSSAVAPDPAVHIFGPMLRYSAHDLDQLDLVPAPRVNHVYQGERSLTVPRERVVTVDGQLLHAALGRQQAGYEWGYRGTGPQALGAAMLAYEYGKDYHDPYSGRFAADIVEALPRERGGIEWTLTSRDIHAWKVLVTLIEWAQRHPGAAVDTERREVGEPDVPFDSLSLEEDAPVDDSASLPITQQPER